MLIKAPHHHVLRDARIEKQLTARQVADACGINIRQYQKFESGERDFSGCSFALGLEVCRALGIDPWTFARDPSIPVAPSANGIPRVLTEPDDEKGRS